MKISRNILIIFLLLISACTNIQTIRSEDRLSPRGDEYSRVQVRFIREGTINRNLDGYINEIREHGELLASFKDELDYKHGLHDEQNINYYRVAVILEPGDHEIQLCNSGGIVKTIIINPLNVQEVKYNRSATDAFFERCGLICKMPVFIITYPFYLIGHLIMGQTD